MENLPSKDNGRENKTKISERSKKLARGMLEVQHALLYGEWMGDFPMTEDTMASQSSLPNLDNAQQMLTSDLSFRKFDVVKDFSGHLLGKHMFMDQMFTHSDSRLKELDVFKDELPEGMYVRACETRHDLLSAAIVGPEGTPYHDGLFFFDLSIPLCYPHYSQLPPTVRYHSAGLQINPNIFKCGAVSLSFLKTAADGSFEKEDMWVPGTTNLLQLLVSIRDVFLCSNPYSKSFGNVREELSLLYNEIIIVRSLKTMIYVMNNPPKNFENLVVGHFRSRVHGILMACRSYMEGGFLAGKKEERCSIAFRNDVASCIKPLVDAFIKIGATEAQAFVSFSEQRYPLLNEPTVSVQTIPNDDRPNSIQNENIDVNVENIAEKSASLMSNNVTEPAQGDGNSTNEDFVESSHEHLKVPMNVNLKKRGWSLASISSSIVEKFKLRRMHM